MKTLTAVLLYPLFFSFLFAEISAEEHVVKLNHGGEVRGNTLTTQKGRTIYAFRSIPYAEPPTGQLRFKNPVPKAPWKGEPIDATTDVPSCVQAPLDNVQFGQEDCLYLNVYTPKLPENDGHNETKMAVMVFIHGGGFYAGSSSSSQYGPGRLLDGNVVLISMNYRLGPFGFLSTDDSASPGNYALMDQLLALQWVKEHVEVFGGNPNEVTLFGESAGSACVGFHMLSPLSSGLFHSVIAQSGSPLSSFALQENPMYWAKRLAVDVECSIHDSAEMIECLRQIPAVQLAKITNGYSKFGLVPTTFVPSVDGSFLPKKPRQIISSGEANWVPFISGINKDEGLVLYGNMYSTANMSDLKNTIEEVIRYMLDKDGHSYEATNIIMNEYLSGNDWTNKTSTWLALVKLFSDFVFRMPLYEMMNLLSNDGFHVYTYSLDYPPSVSLLEYFGIKERLGVSHGDDLGLLFDGPGNVLKNATEDDQKIINVFVSTWTNFAKYNNPTPNAEQESTLEWKQSDFNNMEIYHIDNPVATSTYQPNSDPLYILWTKTVPHYLNKEVQHAGSVNSASVH